MLKTWRDIVAAEYKRDLWLQENLPAEAFQTHAHATVTELYDELARRAGAHYRRLWQTCSKPEKLLLIQLAEEGMVNPGDRASLRELMRKGLIVCEPFPRLMNESFRSFVRLQEPGFDLKAVEQLNEGGWEPLRNFVWPALLVFGLFLLITQRKYFEHTVPLLSAAATEIVALFKVAKGFRDAWPSGPSKS